MARRWEFVFAAIVACGGATSSESAPTDAGSDAAPSPPTDSGTIDAVADAGADAPIADAGHICANDPTPHDFCDDFELPIYFGNGGWDRAVLFNSGRLRVENGTLVAEILSLDSGVGYHPAQLYMMRSWAVPNTPGKRRLTMKYKGRIDECVPDYASFITAAMGGGSGTAGHNYTVDVRIAQAGPDCAARLLGIDFSPADGGNPYFFSDTIPIPTGVFVDYTFVVDETNGTVTANLTAGTQTKSISFSKTAPNDLTDVFSGAARDSYDVYTTRFVTDDVRIDFGK